MRNLKPLLTSGLVIGICLFSALPAMANGTHNRVFSVGPNSALTSQITALRKTDKGLADQLISLKQSIQAQRKTDWAQKSYAALLAANNDQSNMVNDYTTALTDRLTLEKDALQLQTDIQLTNATNIPTDQNKVVADLTSQIAVRTQLVTDALKILTDLGGSIPTSSGTSTTGTSTTGTSATGTSTTGSASTDDTSSADAAQ